MQSCATCSRIKTCGAVGYEKSPENLKRPNLCPLWTDQPQTEVVKPAQAEKKEGAAVKPLHTVEYEKTATALVDAIASYNSHDTNGYIVKMALDLQGLSLKEGVRIGADSLAEKMVKVFTEVETRITGTVQVGKNVVTDTVDYEKGFMLLKAIIKGE